MPHIEFNFIAVKPIRAEHPLGSGQIVEYEPGDAVPAGEWGRAADNLCELGKLVRVAVNVPDPGDSEPVQSMGAQPVGLSDPGLAYLAFEGQQLPRSATEEPVLVEDVDDDGEMEVAEYPVHLGAGLYELSDGSQVKGKAKATKAEAALAAV